LVLNDWVFLACVAVVIILSVLFFGDGFQFDTSITSMLSNLYYNSDSTPIKPQYLHWVSMLSGVAFAIRINTRQYAGSMAIGVYTLPTTRSKILLTKVAVASICNILVVVLGLVVTVVVGGISTGFGDFGRQSSYYLYIIIDSVEMIQYNSIVYVYPIVVVLNVLWIVSLTTLSLSTFGVLLSTVFKNAVLAVVAFVLVLVVLIVIFSIDVAIPDWVRSINPIGYFDMTKIAFGFPYHGHRGDQIAQHQDNMVKHSGAVVGWVMLMLSLAIIFMLSSWWCNKRQEIK
jgi:ABC-type transport system involved in multi-copper enzyme maturation permease subunit